MGSRLYRRGSGQLVIPPHPDRMMVGPVAACRVGEQSAVVWKRLSPLEAELSKFGVRQGPPKALNTPKPHRQQTPYMGAPFGGQQFNRGNFVSDLHIIRVLDTICGRYESAKQRAGLLFHLAFQLLTARNLLARCIQIYTCFNKARYSSDNNQDQHEDTMVVKRRSRILLRSSQLSNIQLPSTELVRRLRLASQFQKIDAELHNS